MISEQIREFIKYDIESVLDTQYYNKSHDEAIFHMGYCYWDSVPWNSVRDFGSNLNRQIEDIIENDKR